MPPKKTKEKHTKKPASNRSLPSSAASTQHRHSKLAEWNTRFAGMAIGLMLPRVLWSIIADYLIEYTHRWDPMFMSKNCRMLSGRKVAIAAGGNWSPAITADSITECIPEFRVRFTRTSDEGQYFVIGMLDCRDLPKSG